MSRNERIAAWCVVNGVGWLLVLSLCHGNCSTMSETLEEENACAHVCLKRGVTSYTVSKGQCFCVLRGEVLK